MDDKDIPNRAPVTEETEEDRWSSDPDTVERRDRDRPESGADADELEIVNRTARAFVTPRRYEEPDDKKD